MQKFGSQLLDIGGNTLQIMDAPEVTADSSNANSGLAPAAEKHVDFGRGSCLCAIKLRAASERAASHAGRGARLRNQIGRASCRER